MYLEQQKILATNVRAFLREKYDVDLANIAIDQPPNVAMGEFALPFAQVTLTKFLEPTYGL